MSRPFCVWGGKRESTYLLPPLTSRAVAVAPSVTAQKILCGMGDMRSPLEVSLSTMSEPESLDVTKYRTKLMMLIAARDFDPKPPH